jgi:hypothetical protein
MTQYELDTAADQIVQWLKGEIAAGRRQFEIRATREYVTEPVGNREEAGLSEETDAASLTTIGILEAWLTGTEDGWRLQVRVEDIVGPHTPEEESVRTGPEEIDLDDFEADFIAPDRGTAFVSVEAETPEAKRRFDRVFADLVRDRHRR